MLHIASCDAAAARQAAVAVEAKRVVVTMVEAQRRTAESGAMMGKRTARRRQLLVRQLLVWIVLAGVWTPAQAQFDLWQRGPWVQQGRDRGDRADQGGYRSDRGRGREAHQGRQPDRERAGSLTPDERRELNRDLQRANREFYRKGREER